MWSIARRNDKPPGYEQEVVPRDGEQPARINSGVPALGLPLKITLWPVAGLHLRVWARTRQNVRRLEVVLVDQNGVCGRLPFRCARTGRMFGFRFARYGPSNWRSCPGLIRRPILFLQGDVARGPDRSGVAGRVAVSRTRSRGRAGVRIGRGGACAGKRWGYSAEVFASSSPEAEEIGRAAVSGQMGPASTLWSIG